MTDSSTCEKRLDKLSTALYFIKSSANQFVLGACIHGGVG